MHSTAQRCSGQAITCVSDVACFYQILLRIAAILSLFYMRYLRETPGSATDLMRQVWQVLRRSQRLTRRPPSFQPETRAR